MKKFGFALVAVLMFSTTAMAIDIACSTQVSWWGEADATTVMENIAASVPVSVEIFSSSQDDALADWLTAHTGNGQADLLILSGRVPTSIYTGGNAQPDGSIAEVFLDDGNCIINTGDWFFYVSNPNNAGDGLANLMDVPGISMSDPIVDVTPTADGQLYTPSFAGFSPSRPWHLEQLDGTEWAAELIMGINDDGTRADPAIIVNTVTGARVGSFFQVAQALVDEKSAVISEWINNWYLLNVSPPGLARGPIPAKGDLDVIRDTVLTWIPGQYPGTHNLYLGESFDEVEGGTVPTASLDVNSFDPGRLEFGKTYYWRVDEVNASADKTVHAGKVWSFEVEPYAIQIPGDSITVTASSVANEFSTPTRTVDGSGLAADNSHSISSEDMWFTEAVDLDPWIQYEFDSVKQLDAMRVWNSNSAAEIAIGWGLKDVEITYSVDGENWDVLAGVTQLTRAPGSPAYNAYDDIAFGGVAAKYVRIDIASNWGGILMSYSLSEVQFDMIPAAARTPDPADGSTGVIPNAVVTWRAGREADSHIIYVSTDQDEVADGLAASLTSASNSVDLSPLDLEMSTMYYWRVDEVNEAEATTVWEGPVWSFTTTDALIVDDFEGYNNVSPDRPFQTWLDGFGYSADEHFPNGYAGNGTGAGIGHDIWSLSSPHYDGDIMETSATIAGSGQSMPFYYTNSGGTVSETQYTFASAQDWTVGGATTLSVAFRGTADNTGSLYVKINGTKVTFDGNASSISRPVWVMWPIDLATLNVSLSNVTEMAIGVDGSNASGMVLIDDITLVGEPFSLPTTMDITSPGDAVQGVPNDDDWPGGEAPANVIDDSLAKYLHFKGPDGTTGFQVTPMVGATIVTGLTFTAANDAAERDPISFELSGSNAGIDGPYTVIAAGDIVDFSQETAWPRDTIGETEITFSNTVAYSHYQVIMTAVRDSASANSMQIAEVELIGTIQ